MLQFYFFYFLNAWIGGRAHGPHGVKWLPESIEVNNINAAIQPET